MRGHLEARNINRSSSNGIRLLPHLRGFILLALSVLPSLGAAQSLDAYLDNGTAKVGVSNSYGGSITWFSGSSGGNLINDYDLGRQAQQSFYAGANTVAKVQASSYSPFPFNPLQAGDKYGNPSTVASLTNSGGVIHVVTTPKLWDRNNIPAQCSMDEWISFHPSMPEVVVVDNRLTCNRDPYDEWHSPVPWPQELPATHFVSTLNNIQSYTGASPWTNDASLSTIAVSNNPYNHYVATENWTSCLDSSGQGVGVYTPGPTTQSAAGGSAAVVSSSPFSSYYVYVNAHRRTVALARNAVYAFRYYLILGNASTIRSDVYSLHSSPPIPMVPAPVTTEGEDGQVTVSWVTTLNEAVSYSVKRSTVSGGPYTAVATGLTGNSYLDTGLADGTTYYYVVTGSNSAGESASSVEASVTPTSDNLLVPNLSFETPTIATYQYAPTGGSWTFGTHAGISRNASAFTSANTEAPDGMQVGFVQGTSSMSQSISRFQAGKVYSVVMSVAQRNNSQPAQAWTVTLDGTTIASFTPSAIATEYATYITPGFTTTSGSHTIALVGTDPSSANSTIFVDKVSIVGAGAAPGVPNGVEAVTGNNHVVINWSQTPATTSYTVLRSSTSGGPYTALASGVTVTTYDDTTAVNGAAYYYVVSATNANGTSANSSEVSSTPQNISIIVDDASSADVSIKGTWTSSAATSGYYGTGYLNDGNTGSAGRKRVIFWPTITVPGTYDVYARWTAASNRATNVPVDINYRDTLLTTSVNQQANGGTWVLLGSYRFSAGVSGYIAIRNDGANGYVIADAVQLVLH